MKTNWVTEKSFNSPVKTKTHPYLSAIYKKILAFRFRVLFTLQQCRDSWVLKSVFRNSIIRVITNGNTDIPRFLKKRHIWHESLKKDRYTTLIVYEPNFFSRRLLLKLLLHSLQLHSHNHPFSWSSPPATFPPTFPNFFVFLFFSK